MADLLQRLQSALVDRYRVDFEIGRGGMSIVYRAEELKHQRPVALKVLLPEIAAVLGPERFQREIATAARLQHPHILTVLDSGAAAGLLYYIMPFIEGESLRARLEREGQLPVADAVRLTTEVAGALEYAHRHGVVHRDIKPENILLSAGQAVVADFGIARAIDAAGGVRLTETGVTLGTPQYMSPEQFLGVRDLDGRSDQYSLGCVLFEMLAGRAPFVGPPESYSHQHLNTTVPPVTSVRPAVPPELERVLGRALAKMPADRFPSALGMAEALAASVPTDIPGPPVPAPPATGSTPSAATVPVGNRRRRTAMAAGAVALVALLGLVFFWRPLLRLMGIGAPPAHVQRQWILVADFDAPAEDDGTARAIRELVGASLDQSSVVATVSLDGVREALRASARSDTARLTVSLARELAYRSSVRTVVSGQVNRLGQGWSLVLRVWDVERDSLLLTVDEVAHSEDALIPTVERLARQLREALGERHEAIKATREARLVVTPSFEAYRKYVTAVQLGEGGDWGAGLILLRQALMLDPDFAMAYNGMGVAFRNQQLKDSSMWAFERALRHPDRLSDARYRLIQADLAFTRNELPQALVTLDALLAQDSTTKLPLWERRGHVLSRMGRSSEARRSYQEYIDRSVFAPRQVGLFNLFHGFLAEGNYRGARTTLDLVRGPSRDVYEIWLAESEGRWNRAESLATALVAASTTSARARWHALRALAGRKAARGQVIESARVLREASAIDRSSIGRTDWTRPGHREDRAQLLLALASGSPVVPPHRTFGLDTTAALLTAGIRSATLGDTTEARELLARLRGRPRSQVEDCGAGPSVLDALIAGRCGRWSDVVRVLDSVAREDDEWGLITDKIGRAWPRWLMAEAWEQMGRPDSAAAYYELATSAGKSFLFEETRMISSFAHQRLVLLYARMGRIADAERHWRIFSETFTAPDPEVSHLLDDTRAALAAARGMSRPTRL